MKKYNCIIILGPTASGKTKLAVQTAAHVNGEIISIDSRQVYQQLTIGTGKDLEEYKFDNTFTPYHLIDIISPEKKYNSFDFANDFYKVFYDITKRNKLPVLCGGTGLYFDILLKKNNLVAVPNDLKLRDQLELKTREELIQRFELYPKTNKYKFDTSTAKRLIRAIEVLEYLKENEVPEIKFHELKPLIIGVKTTLDQRRERISTRLNYRLNNGLIEEAQNLIKQGISHEQLQYFGLEYKFLSLFLLGKLSLEEMHLQLETAIHQYAKRQMTWWRKMERDGYKINWIENFEELNSIIKATDMDNL